jgi:hypothetical protein
LASDTGFSMKSTAPRRGFDRRVHGAMARHHDDGAPALFSDHSSGRDAVGIGHPNIEQDQVEFALFAGRRASSHRLRS